MLTGRTGCNRIVQFAAPDSPAATPRSGALARVAITRTHAHSLIGKLLPESVADAAEQAAAAAFTSLAVS